MKTKYIIIIIVIAVFPITFVSSVDAQGKYSIPAWVKGIAGFWAEDKISDQEFGEGLSFLIDQGIIDTPKITELENKVAQLEAENAKLRSQQGSTSPPITTPPPSYGYEIIVSIPAGSAVPGCEEYDACYIPSIVFVNPGETVTWYNDDNAAHTVTSGTPSDGPDGAFDSSLIMGGDAFSVDFNFEGKYPYFCMMHPWQIGEVIVSSESYPSEDYYPESLGETEFYIDPSEFCWGNAACFTGEVTQVIDGDTIKVDGESIRFTLSSTPELSEYGGKDAKRYVESVCPVGSFVVVDEDDYQTQGSYGRMIALIWCYDPSHDWFFNLNEDVLIAGHAEISTSFCSKSEFEYDYWAQEYGCGQSYYYEEPSYEPPKYTPPPSTTPEPSCDPSYPDVCIPPYPPDLDCGEISYRNFRVTGSDPHGFDGDKDGIGCES